jgi:hypothetical protein
MTNADGEVIKEHKTIHVPGGDNHYKCYNVSNHKHSKHRKSVVSLKDQFAEARTEVEEAELHCNPVSKNDEPVGNPLAHLVMYEI